MGETEKVRIQFELPKEKVKRIKFLKEECGMRTTTELFNNALTFLEWAAREVKSGRVIASVDTEREKYKELTMPWMMVVKKKEV